MSGRGRTFERWVAEGVVAGKGDSVLVEGFLFSNKQGLGKMWTDEVSLESIAM